MTFHTELLKKYAELVVGVGLNLRRGQRLIIHNASTRGVPLHAAPLVQEIARVAYQAGARLVDVIWNDEALLRTRVQYASADSFEEYPTWHVTALMDHIERGDALLTIRSNNPDLLSDLDAGRVGAMQKTHLQHFNPVSMAITSNRVNWCVIAAAGADWAAKVFPHLSREQAEARLWEAIFEITRVDQPDPLAAWQKHIENLTKRARYLSAKQYAALHYTAPGTDLTIGLPRGHKWISARSKAQNGIDFTANLPTEEVFTLAHREQVDGVIRASMPLSYSGMLIEDFSLTFEKGRVVKVSARKGEAILQKLVDTDEGARHLGEVALVPHSSPIARRGHLFFDALIDENAASHLAIGRAYRFNLEDGEALSDEEFRARGGNTSLTHVDFMVGSGEMNIDGIRPDGQREAVMRQGEWAFEI
jgi:aminopeptidase